MKAWVIVLIIFIVLIVIIAIGLTLWFILREPREEEGSGTTPPSTEKPTDPGSDEDSDESSDEDGEDEDEYEIPDDGEEEEILVGDGSVVNVVFIDRAIILPGGIFLKTKSGATVSPYSTSEGGYGLEISLTPSYEWSSYNLRIRSSKVKNSVLQTEGQVTSLNRLTKLLLAFDGDLVTQNAINTTEEIVFFGSNLETDNNRDVFMIGMGATSGRENAADPAAEAITKETAGLLPTIKASETITVGGETHTARNIAMFAIYSLNSEKYLNITNEFKTKESGVIVKIWDSANGRIFNSYGWVLEIDESLFNVIGNYASLRWAPYQQGKPYQEAYVIGDFIFFTGMVSTSSFVYYLYYFDNNGYIDSMAVKPEMIGPDLPFQNGQKVIIKI